MRCPALSTWCRWALTIFFSPDLVCYFFFFTRFCLLAEYVSGRISWPKTEAYAAGNGNKYRSARKA